MHVTAIIAAGGRGERFGGAQPKQLLAVGGRPILERSVDVFLSHPAVDAVVVALPRETIFLAQTPQAFRRGLLAEALALGGDATDEATLAERAGHSVRIVEGEASNIKITTADDLAIAEAIAETLRIADGGLRTGA